jgi:ZIP family zinc transporter
MAAALGWGALAASSLVIGAVLAFARHWAPLQTGLVLAFGAGALISAVSFELAGEGIRVGSQGTTAAGLAAGALTYFACDGIIARRFQTGRGRRGRAQGGDAGTALALGAFLDGIPEQLVLGIGLGAGQGVSVSLMVAIFVSNLPESIGSADQMREAGRSESGVLRLWVVVAVICTLSTVAGYAISDSAGGDLRAMIDGFAAGALLVMLIDSMIPEARDKAEPRADSAYPSYAGLVAVLGFAVAAGLSFAN